MTIMRWNPWSDLETLQGEINRLFDTTAERTAKTARAVPSFTPTVDIFEEADKFVIKFDLPEVSVQDVEIHVENQSLQVKGERKLEREDTKNGYHRIERAYGTFSRAFTLPTNVDADRIAATAKDGVLRLELPKKAEAQPRKIAISQVN